MNIKLIKEKFSICKVEDVSSLDFNCGYLFLAVTDDEISVICPEDKVPSSAYATEGDWFAFKIDETLDFSTVGILAKISTILAQNNMPILAISTYNTDYIFVKSEHTSSAVKALEDNNYRVL